MSRLESVLAAILESPRDDALRLVYADALEEEGEGLRAELIRRSLSGEDTKDLRANSDVVPPLVREHADTWEFERGLVSLVHVRLSALVAHGEELLASAPITHVALLGDDELDDPGEVGAALAKINGFRRVDTITAWQCGLETELLAEWLPHYDSLRSLGLMYANGADVAELLAYLELPALREVRFWMESGDYGDEIAHVLSRAEMRHALERLDISGCEITDEGVHAIAESPCLRSLRCLLFGSSSYSTTVLTEDAMRALAKETVVTTNLRTLELPGTGVTDAMLAVLSTHPASGLEVLNLEDNALTTEGVAAVLHSPLFRQLKELQLRGNSVDVGAIGEKGGLRVVV